MKCPDGPSPRNSENHDSFSISCCRPLRMRTASGQACVRPDRLLSGHTRRLDGAGRQSDLESRPEHYKAHSTNLGSSPRPSSTLAHARATARAKRMHVLCRDRKCAPCGWSSARADVQPTLADAIGASPLRPDRAEPQSLASAWQRPCSGSDSRLHTIHNDARHAGRGSGEDQRRAQGSTGRLERTHGEPQTAEDVRERPGSPSPGLSVLSGRWSARV